MNSKKDQRESSLLARLPWVSSTYFAEGLPWSLLHQVASEYFTAIGARPAQVGITSLLHAPSLLKVVWSPVVALIGSLRGWMVGTQAAMGVAVGLLAIVAHGIATGPDPAHADTTWIWILLLSVGILSATHDIACDGFYMAALDDREQARFSGLRVAAFRAAMLVGSSGLVVLAGRSGWLWGFGAGALLLVALAAGHWFLLPRSRKPATESKQRPLRTAYLSFLGQDSILLVVGFIVTYKMADALMFSMSRPLLDRTLGIGLELRGWIGPFSTSAGILGAVLGGAWISNKGLKTTILPITLFMALTQPLYALVATFPDYFSVFVDGQAASLSSLDWSRSALPLGMVTLVIIIEQLCGGLATAAQMVFIMRRCHPDFRTEHFAFATALYSVAQMGLGSLSGFVYEQVGPAGYFWIVSLLTLPAVLLARVVPTDAQLPEPSGSEAGASPGSASSS